jgi:putative oxidoreductase
MFVAYWTADRDALVSIFSDPGKFYVADPYSFLFASLMVLILGRDFFTRCHHRETHKERA